MSYSEWVLWNKYFNKYGPLNPVRKYDRSGAILGHMVNHALGGKSKLEDFFPWGVKNSVDNNDDDEVEDLSIGEYIKKVFGGKVKIGKRKCR